MNEEDHDVMDLRLAYRILSTRRSALTAELLVLALLGGVIGAVALHLDAAGSVRVDRAFAMMGFGAAVAAAILLGLAAWLSAGGRAVRVALAVAVYSTAFLSTTVVERDGTPTWPGWTVLGHVALVAVLGLLVSSLRRDDVRPRGWYPPFVVAGVVVVAATTAAFARADVLGGSVPNLVGAVIDSAGAAVALALWLSGYRGDRPLLRRVGLAFGAVMAGRLAMLVAGDQAEQQPLFAAVSELTGSMVLLLTAVPFAITSVSTLWTQHEEWQAQLAAAAAAAESVAERDHEMRNLVLGLTGAAGAIGARIDSPTGRHLHAAASAELQRLRVMLDGGATAATGTAAPVGSVLHDLAAVHRAGGADVSVRAEGSLCAHMDPQVLAQVVTNLLVNCARHAPGTPVQLAATRCGPTVRISVTDHGPGLPAGIDPEELLRSGVRGGTAPGHGLGLHITADLVRRHGGTMRLEPTRPGPGCTVVIDLLAVDVRSMIPEPIGG